MDMMNQVFKLYLDKFVIVFINDILIYSSSKEEHEEHLKTMLMTLKEHRLFAKFSKCEFWLSQVAFLGHAISVEGISIDPAKVSVVRNWRQPSTIIEIKSFLGLDGYYRKFIEEFSKIVSPFTRLTQKDVKFDWDDQCEKIFWMLKEKLTTALVLAMLDGSGGYKVYTDATKNGLGCVLIQHEKVITYGS